MILGLDGTGKLRGYFRLASGNGRKGSEGAKAYTIYRSTKKDGGFIRLKIVKGGKKTAFLDNKVKKGKTYYYKVVVKTKKGYSAPKAAKGVKVKR